MNEVGRAIRVGLPAETPLCVPGWRIANLEVGWAAMSADAQRSMVAGNVARAPVMSFLATAIGSGLRGGSGSSGQIEHRSLARCRTVTTERPNLPMM
jgi:hypothetical protein